PTLTLTGLNTFTGPTTISSGTLSVSAIGNGGVSSGIGASGTGAGNLVFDGGTLIYTGSAASTNRNFSITSGKTAIINVTNMLTISGSSAATTGNLTKIGPGTLVLSGDNGNNVGDTLVSVGT